MFSWSLEDYSPVSTSPRLNTLRGSWRRKGDRKIINLQARSREQENREIVLTTFQI